jgi:DNA-binding MarR family transcriptional regulator
MPVKFAIKIPQLAVWMLLHQTYYSILKCEDELFTQVDLTTQQHNILLAIKYINGPATPTQIANWVDRNLNTVTLIVDRMHKNGLVKRARDMDDRRSFRLILTEKGDAYLNRGTKSAITLIKRLLENLSDDELQTLETLLAKVRLQAIQHHRKDNILREVTTREDPEVVNSFLAQRI